MLFFRKWNYNIALYFRPTPIAVQDGKVCLLCGTVYVGLCDTLVCCSGVFGKSGTNENLSTSYGAGEGGGGRKLWRQRYRGILKTAESSTSTGHHRVGDFTKKMSAEELGVTKIGVVLMRVYWMTVV